MMRWWRRIFSMVNEILGITVGLYEGVDVASTS
jgi:hypothetical protein